MDFKKKFRDRVMNNSQGCSATNYSLFWINQAVLDAQGYAECPDSRAGVHCGKRAGRESEELRR